MPSPCARRLGSSVLRTGIHFPSVPSLRLADVGLKSCFPAIASPLFAQRVVVREADVVPVALVDLGR